MMIDVTAERLIVISDLHLGNPASRAWEQLPDFLDYVRTERLALCINGDGFEMLQTRFSRLIREALPLMTHISRLRREGLPVYYVAGNHDIYVEHFLDEWLATRICPFLNVTSGESVSASNTATCTIPSLRDRRICTNRSPASRGLPYSSALMSINSGTLLLSASTGDCADRPEGKKSRSPITEPLMKSFGGASTLWSTGIPIGRRASRWFKAITSTAAVGSAAGPMLRSTKAR